MKIIVVEEYDITDCDMDISIMEEFSVLEHDFGCNQFKAKDK